MRLSLGACCVQLVEQIESAERTAAAIEAERTTMEAAQQQNEAARGDLRSEIAAKEAEAAELEARAEQTRSENAELVSRLQREREECRPLQAEVDALRKQLAEARHRGDLEVAELEAQVVDAIEVQGSLRFSLLRSQAEAERALCLRESMEARATELRERLEEARASYVYAIDALDQKVAGLEREGFEAERAAERLERALESTAFRVRMAEVELQRWAA